MKKLYTLLTAVVITANVFAQAPEKMSYQAVVRDADNALVTNQLVGMQLSILQGSVSGTSVYLETQTPTTNSNGLVSIEIGDGNVVSGTFNKIDWSAGPYYIKTETDPTGGTSYTITGTSQLMSVPFALYAQTAENVVNDNDADPTNEIQELSFNDGTIFLSQGGSAKLPNAVTGFDGDFNNLTNIPADLADGDDNTQLDADDIEDLGFAKTTEVNSMINSNSIAIIPLWLGSEYSMSNTQGEDLSNCVAGLDPTLFNASGNIEVSVVIYLSESNGTNFQLHKETTDESSHDIPITHEDTWTLTQTGNSSYVAKSAWKSWAAGSSFVAVRLHGWINDNTGPSKFGSAYLMVRSE